MIYQTIFNQLQSGSMLSKSDIEYDLNIRSMFFAFIIDAAKQESSRTTANAASGGVGDGVSCIIMPNIRILI